jgi:hypothetical protein
VGAYLQPGKFPRKSLMEMPERGKWTRPMERSGYYLTVASVRDRSVQSGNSRRRRRDEANLSKAAIAHVGNDVRSPQLLQKNNSPRKPGPQVWTRESFFRQKTPQGPQMSPPSAKLPRGEEKPAQRSGRRGNPAISKKFSKPRKFTVPWASKRSRIRRPFPHFPDRAKASSTPHTTGISTQNPQEYGNS